MSGVLASLRQRLSRSKERPVSAALRSAGMRTPMAWAELANLAAAELPEEDLVNGPANSRATLRLFGETEEAVRVTLYRDNHAWCPYCQKVWLFLEERRIPYRVKKVTMFCYGEKEAWYKRIVPSGMLPALELDGEVVTESDDILHSLEAAFGPLGASLDAPEVVPLRRLERKLFGAWCQWLCYPSDAARETAAQAQFEAVAGEVERALEARGGPYFLGSELSVVDLVFTPYVERMQASLFYYKGFALRDKPALGRWFDAMEARETYRGTQSDVHTHAHDLPPQMGGCYGTAAARSNMDLVDHGPFAEVPDVGYAEPATARWEAVARVAKHREALIKVNPASAAVADESLRAALTLLATGEPAAPPAGADVSLRYVRDRVSCPRDMSVWAAKRLRAALEQTAALAGDEHPDRLPTRHRKDQDPRRFARQ